MLWPEISDARGCEGTTQSDNIWTFSTPFPGALHESTGKAIACVKV